MENKEPYNQIDHVHCWNQKVPACGIEKASHKVCCLCEKPMENKETNEKSGWEEEFYGLKKTMDGQHRPKLLLFIKNVEKEAYERGKDDGAMMATNVCNEKTLPIARLEGKKEAEVALIAELEGMKKKHFVFECNGAYGGKGCYETFCEDYKGECKSDDAKTIRNHNSTIDLIISNLRERIQ